MSFSNHVFVFHKQVPTHTWIISRFLLLNLASLFSKLLFLNNLQPLHITSFDQVSSRCHKIAQIVHFLKRKTMNFYGVSISRFSDFGILIKISLLSESQNRKISESRNLRISESEISESQNLRISESRIAESQKLRISESENRRISESRNLRISESQIFRISGSQNFRI